MKTYEWVLEVVSKIETLLQDFVVDGNAAFSDVVLGWKQASKKIPAVYILPDEDLLTIPSVAADYHTLRFLIVVETELTTLKGSLLDAIKLAGRTQDLFTSDRTLTGTVDNLEVRRWEYDWPRVRQYRRHFVVLRLELWKYLIPS